MSNSGMSSIDGVKMKIKMLQKQADEADERALRLQRTVDAERILREKAEDQLEMLTKEVQQKEDEQEDVQERLAAAQRDLQEMERVVEDSTRGTVVIQSKAVKDEQCLERQIMHLQEAKDVAEEADCKYLQASQKLAMVENDLDSAEDRCRESESLSRQREEELHLKQQDLKSYSASVSKFTNKEDYLQDTLHKLKQQVKEAEDRADYSEANVQRLEKLVDDLKVCNLQ
uniref:tropomyosin alpha-3 chain-like n=1 Tax=Myxine glutinosa TaxID=7769 RepID=UPI003590104F